MGGAAGPAGPSHPPPPFPRRVTDLEMKLAVNLWGDGWNVLSGGCRCGHPSPLPRRREGVSSDLRKAPAGRGPKRMSTDDAGDS